MNDQIVLREFREEDRLPVEEMIREAWKYDEFCSPGAAARLARVYLNSCLANQTFNRVAVVGLEPAGIIMGKNVRSHKCPFRYRLKQVISILAMLSAREGRSASKIFGGVEDLDRQLLEESGKEYPGELAFFVVSARFRGKGLGKMLFESVQSYMREEKIPEFFLFTDTSCNYPFYEHQGMKRRCRRKHTLHIGEQSSEMEFYLYESSVRDFGN